MTLADAMGVSRTAVSKWFMGMNKPNMARYEQLIELLRLDENNTHIQMVPDRNTGNGVNEDKKVRKVDSIINSIYKKMSAVQKSNNHSKEKLKNMINILYADELLETITNEIMSISKEPKD